MRETDPPRDHRTQAICKVLVVDDSPLLQRIHGIALRAYRRRALQPLSALNGREALARLSEHPDTALVLLDINMPGMSGLEFLGLVRAEPAFQGIPVILQSTEDRAEDVARGLAAGARGYLTKPFTPQQLHRQLDEFLP